DRERHTLTVFGCIPPAGQDGRTRIGLSSFEVCFKTTWRSTHGPRGHTRYTEGCDSETGRNRIPASLRKNPRQKTAMSAFRRESGAAPLGDCPAKTCRRKGSVKRTGRGRRNSSRKVCCGATRET